MKLRNDFMIQKAINDTFKKSAIIYDAGHISFLIDSLRNYGFELKTINYHPIGASNIDWGKVYF